MKMEKIEILFNVSMKYTEAQTQKHTRNDDDDDDDDDYPEPHH